MFHLLFMYNATMLVISSPSATLINESETFPTGKHRVIYDVIMDATTRAEEAGDFENLIMRILQYVQSENHEIVDGGLMPIDIKYLIMTEVINDFGWDYTVPKEEYVIDYSERYKTLVKRCFDLKNFDAETAKLSMKKKFFEYTLEDYKINFVLSYVAFMYTNYSYEFIMSMFAWHGWTPSHSRHLQEVTSCFKEYADVITPHQIYLYDFLNYDFNSLLLSEFNYNVYKEKYQKEYSNGRRSIFFFYSTKEILDLIKKMMKKAEKNGKVYQTYLEAIDDSKMALGLEKLFKDKPERTPWATLKYRDITKYEMMTTYKREIVDEETLKEWQNDMAKLDINIKDSVKYIERD